MNTTTENLDNMTNEELKELVAARYQAAANAGTLTMLRTIAKELGKMIHPEGKYLWKHNEISVYVDDYGNYMTVAVGPQKVASTLPSERFFIDGSWLDEALSFYEQAKSARDAWQGNQAQKERQELLSRLR